MKYPIEVKKARCHECGKRSWKLVAVRITVMHGLNGPITHPTIALCPKHVR